ncbi:monovalent cation/H+ antiporter complex subunit F [Tepidiforma sp.]|uniref:monovalent cation/H+ antiporter complex subunit F n=1 Tax=Tepidiforma sp. TaxID=2682230 RepID=UPI002ADE1E39|nr:monovalent cation/H+ antiporter complex subunit F [Tepidiforma sp.]
MSGLLAGDPWLVAAVGLLCGGVVLAGFRLLRGPSLPDRVVALDLLTLLGLGLLTVYAIAAGETAYLDVGIVLTLVTFLATTAFAYYIEKGATPRGDGDD